MKTSDDIINDLMGIRQSIAETFDKVAFIQTAVCPFCGTSNRIEMVNHNFTGSCLECNAKITTGLPEFDE
jgi:hypothetical protein